MSRPLFAGSVILAQSRNITIRIISRTKANRTGKSRTVSCRYPSVSIAKVWESELIEPNSLDFEGFLQFNSLDVFPSAP
jgi:hypothetical protein